MRYWLILAAILAGACSGCGAMEDFILGPDPYYAQPGVLQQQPSCGMPPPTVVQTQEPPR